MMQNNKPYRLNDTKKYLLFSQLHSLLNAGLSFSRSFDLLIQGERKQKEKDLLKNVYQQVLVGNELWKGMELAEAFTGLDCGVIRIGEETGKLDRSLIFLCDYYHKKNEQRRMLAGALSYPTIIVVVAALVLFFMITVVVPMFEQIYSRMGGQLPEVTVLLLKMSSYFPTVLLISAIVLVSFIVIKQMYGKTEKYRKLSSSALMHIPLIGNLIRTHYQAQFCKLLYLLVCSGVPLIRSLSMLEAVIRFYPYSKSFSEIISGLKQGDSFASKMEGFREIYGNKLVTLIRVGEETNCLDKMLLNQGNDLTSELEHNLKQLGNILEPALILGIGAIVAFVLIAMYMPMFQLGQTIQ
ncbi:type II secretion system F family protein [Bacteroides sp. UBA939]|uniref:type II secretion system F family protein n=1 Tax=Bacteroides sp. UBA939 TaxID=1946092 RepID=UPI0025B8598E|nr:type II secretion system F family protein [Bacteroides sp. UBA939]